MCWKAYWLQVIVKVATSKMQLLMICFQSSIIYQPTLLLIHKSHFFPSHLRYMWNSFPSERKDEANISPVSLIGRGVQIASMDFKKIYVICLFLALLVVNTTGNGKILSRKKRWLAFPDGSSVAVSRYLYSFHEDQVFILNSFRLPCVVRSEWSETLSLTI